MAKYRVSDKSNNVSYMEADSESEAIEKAMSMIKISVGGVLQTAADYTAEIVKESPSE